MNSSDSEDDCAISTPPPPKHKPPKRSSKVPNYLKDCEVSLPEEGQNGNWLAIASLLTMLLSVYRKSPSKVLSNWKKFYS